MIYQKNLKNNADWPPGVARDTKKIVSSKSWLFKNQRRLAPLLDLFPKKTTTGFWGLIRFKLDKWAKSLRQINQGLQAEHFDMLFDFSKAKLKLTVTKVSTYEKPRLV